MLIEIAYCPRCGRAMLPYKRSDGESNHYPEGVCDRYGGPLAYAALSRRDNETYICSRCGESEAIEDYGGMTYKGKPYWNEGAAPVR